MLERYVQCLCFAARKYLTTCGPKLNSGDDTARLREKEETRRPYTQTYLQVLGHRRRPRPRTGTRTNGGLDSTLKVGSDLCIMTAPEKKKNTCLPACFASSPYKD